MDLGLAGRTAILLGSSRGLGRACAESLAREGVHVVINGRSETDVQTTVQSLRDTYGIEVHAVIGDSTLAQVQDELLRVCPEPDIVLLNGQGPPPMPFEKSQDTDWDNALQQSLVAPLNFVRKVLPGMKERRFGRIVAVSSAMTKSPHSMMHLSIGSRLGLAGVLKSISKDVAKFNVTINQLLPERFDTDRQQQMAQVAMKLQGVTYDEARAQQVASIKAGRLGLPHEFGDTFAFVCSAQASYMSGQSIQLDGGSYEGVF